MIKFKFILKYIVVFCLVALFVDTCIAQTKAEKLSEVVAKRQAVNLKKSKKNIILEKETMSEIKKRRLRELKEEYEFKQKNGFSSKLDEFKLPEIKE